MKGKCRLCLQNKAEFYIFSENSTTHEKIMSYCKLEIYKDDGLPDEVCALCLQKLDIVVEFINKCEESDKLLRSECNQSWKVKEESIECSPNSFKLEQCDGKNYFDDALSPGSLDFHTEIKVEIDDLTKERYDCLTNQADDCKTSSSNKKSKKCKPQSKLKTSGFKEKIPKVSKSKNVDNENFKFKFEISIDDDILNSKIKSDPEEYKPDMLPLSKESNKSTKKSKRSLKKRREESIKTDIETGEETKKRSRKSKFEDESSLCPVCGKWFERSRTFRQHFQRHSGILHKCSKCPKTFATRELMKGHEQRHLHIRGFPCEVCGATFSSNYLSKKHFLIVHKRAKAVACKICSKVLCNPRGLMEHMKIHTGEKSFECHLCQKKFAHKLSLTCHIRVHTGEQPYVCQYCDKRFSIGKSLKEHERLHTGEKPYVCPLCPKRFEQLSNMKSHFRYNHKGLDFNKVRDLKANEKT